MFAAVAKGGGADIAWADPWPRPSGTPPPPPRVPYLRPREAVVYQNASMLPGTIATTTVALQIALLRVTSG